MPDLPKTSERTELSAACPDDLCALTVRFPDGVVTIPCFASMAFHPKEPLGVVSADVTVPKAALHGDAKRFEDFMWRLVEHDGLISCEFSTLGLFILGEFSLVSSVFGEEGDGSAFFHMEAHAITVNGVV